MQDILTFAQRYKLTLGIALLTLWIYTKYKKELAYWGHARMPKLSGFKRGNIERAVGEGGGQLLLDRLASRDFGRMFGALDKLREDAKQLNSFGHEKLRLAVVKNEPLLNILSGSRQNVDPVTEVVTPDIVAGLFRSEQVSEPIKVHLLSKCTKDELIGLMNASEGTDSFRQSVLEKLSSLVDCQQYVSWLCDRHFCEKQSDVVLKKIAYPVLQQAVAADFETLTKTLAPPLDGYKYRVLIALNQASARNEDRRKILFSDMILQEVAVAADHGSSFAGQLLADLLLCSDAASKALMGGENFVHTVSFVAKNPKLCPPGSREEVGSVFIQRLVGRENPIETIRLIDGAMTGECGLNIARLLLTYSNFDANWLITPKVIEAICQIAQPAEAFSELKRVVQKFGSRISLAHDCVKKLIEDNPVNAFAFLQDINTTALTGVLTVFSEPAMQDALVREIPLEKNNRWLPRFLDDLRSKLPADQAKLVFTERIVRTALRCEGVYDRLLLMVGSGGISSMDDAAVVVLRTRLMKLLSNPETVNVVVEMLCAVADAKKPEGEAFWLALWDWELSGALLLKSPLGFDTRAVFDRLQESIPLSAINAALNTMSVSELVTAFSLMSLEQFRRTQSVFFEKKPFALIAEVVRAEHAQRPVGCDSERWTPVLLLAAQQYPDRMGDCLALCGEWGPRRRQATEAFKAFDQLVAARVESHPAETMPAAVAALKNPALLLPITHAACMS